MGGTAVAQKVGRYSLAEAGRLGTLPDDEVERLRAEPAARDRGDEERRLLRGRHEARAGLPEIAPQSVEGVGADRHDAIPAALAAADPYCPSLLVEVEEVQVAQLRPPEASGVKGFQDGAVPETEIVGSGGFDKRCHFGLGQDRLRQRRVVAA